MTVVSLPNRVPTFEKSSRRLPAALGLNEGETPSDEESGVSSLETLKRIKEDAGRPQDFADLIGLRLQGEEQRG
jgi:hypothetical protein